MRAWLGFATYVLLLSASASFADDKLGVFSFAQLENLVLNLSAPDVTSVVRALPSFVRDNVTFVYNSYSAQPAQMQWGDSSPRAIVWDSQATFVATMNGYDQAPGYDALELMQYSNDQFVFGMTTFKNGEKPIHLDSQPLCLACHGEKSRPIWPEYPNWKGTYGSREDIIQPNEIAHFDNFKRSALAGSRYQPLVSDRSWANYPYKKDDNVNVEAESHTFKYRPNTRFGILLNRLNAKRVLSIMRNQPRFATEKAKLAYAFLGCGSDAKALNLVKQYGFEMRDLDLRYLYPDPRYNKMKFSDSYFDGASTFNELMAGALIEELKLERDDLKDIHLNSLSKLYYSKYHQLEDADFFMIADNLGLWVRTPFAIEQHSTKLRPLPNGSETANFKYLCERLAQ